MSNSNSRDEWDAMAEVTRRPVCAHAERVEHTAIRDAVAAGRGAERAAVVAWLRGVADDPETFVEEATLLRSTSNAIESGEHRREENE